MVKVLRCYHFKSQAVIPCEGEPVALYASPDSLFVATTDRRVEVYDLKQPGFPVRCCFNTEAQVLQIIYNSAGNYIATLETKKSILAEYKFVKVYLNWNVDQGKQPVKVRIAGKPLGFNVKDGNVRKSEVIDIAVTGNVHQITSCQSTSNLAVVVESKVFLYKLVTKTFPNSTQTYQDILLYLHLNWSTAISSVALCEEYLACLNSNHAQLVRVWYKTKTKLKAEKPEAETSSWSDERNLNSSQNLEQSADIEIRVEHSEKDGRSTVFEENLLGGSTQNMGFLGDKKYSCIGMRASPNPLSMTTETSSTKTGMGDIETITDDENFVLWDFSDDVTGVQFGESKSSTRLPGSNKAKSKTIYLNEFHATSGGGSPVSVPVQGKPIQPQVIDHTDEDNTLKGEVSVSVVLQLKQRSTDEFKAIQLLPTYVYDRTEETQLGEGSSTGHSVQLAGLCCFLEAGYSGLMYSVLPTPHLLSHYKFASEALKVVCSHNVIHVITGAGVETYTARCNLAALYNTETFDNVTKTIPPPDLETCLVSFQQFIGIKQAALSDRYLHMLTKVESRVSTSKASKGKETSWSLYVLEPSSVTDLYKDMVILGTRNQESSPPTYLHLLQEGHITLQSHLINYRERDVKVEDLLLESCALLGDYYSHPGCSDWRLALPYYLMSGLSVEDIMRLAILQKQVKKTSKERIGQGLINYLNYTVFEDNSQQKIKAMYCDSILQCYAEADPVNLSKVIMFGKYQNFDAGKSATLLESCMTKYSNTEKKNRCADLLCLALLNLRLCEPEKALSALSAISKTDVIQICVENHKLLHTDYTELSPLSQLMRQHFSPVFITILVALQDTGTITMDMALTLLKSNVYQSEVHKNTHVKEYLEALIKDERRQKIFDEAAAILCDIYLQRLLEWKPPTSREFPSTQFTMPKGNGFFAGRYSWLDYLPPFYDPKNMKQPCQYLQFTKPGVGSMRAKVMSQPIKIEQHQLSQAGCPCCLCNEDLLKLQAMLSSGFVTEKILRLISSRLQGNESNRVYESLWLLCVTHIDFRQAVDILVEKYPSVLPEFLVGCVGKNTEKLSYTVESLISALGKAAAYPTSQDNNYVEAVKGVMDEMASRVPVDNFIQLLPADGSLLAFLPYIIKCCQAEELRNLTSQITAKGDNLRSGV